MQKAQSKLRAAKIRTGSADILECRNSAGR